MPQTTTASAVFPNRRAALRAAERLAGGGFARGSIDLHRLHSDDEAFEVSVRVREGNVRRADDLLHARPDVHDFAGRGYTAYAMRAQRDDLDRPRPDRRGRPPRRAA